MSDATVVFKYGKYSILKPQKRKGDSLYQAVVEDEEGCWLLALWGKGCTKEEAIADAAFKIGKRIGEGR